MDAGNGTFREAKQEEIMAAMAEKEAMIELLLAKEEQQAKAKGVMPRGTTLARPAAVFYVGQRLEVNGSICRVEKIARKRLVLSLLPRPVGAGA